VPTAASWRLAPLPRSITEDQMSLLLTHCDRGRVTSAELVYERAPCDPFCILGG
jgi:hypothetical protein